MSDKWYNGPEDPPYLAYVYLHKYTNVFPPEDVDTLERVRDHYDKIGLKYGFEFKLKKPYKVCLDYYPVGIDDMWKLAPTLKCGGTDLGRVKSISIPDEGDSLIVKTSGMAIEFYYPGIIRRYNSIVRAEQYNERMDENDREEEAFRRSL